MTFAAMLLVSISAFAQSGNNEPLKGDVNGDGVVDVADIAAVIAIIKTNAAPQTTYYWYVGTTMPSDPTSEEENTGFNKWHNLGASLPTESIEVTMVDDNYENHQWYVAAPHDANFTLYNALNSSEDLGWSKSSINIGAVSYDLWTANNPSYQAAVYLHK